MTTPPWIERFREKFMVGPFLKSEGNWFGKKKLADALEDFITQELAREGSERHARGFKEGYEEGAEEKMKEVLEIGDELQQEYANGDIFWADLKEKLTKK